MAINDEHRQLATAPELAEAARTHAHPRAVPIPSGSYTPLGELRATIDSLEQVCHRVSA